MSITKAAMAAIGIAALAGCSTYPDSSMRSKADGPLSSSTVGTTGTGDSVNPQPATDGTGNTPTGSAAGSTTPNTMTPPHR